MELVMPQGTFKAAEQIEEILRIYADRQLLDVAESHQKFKTVAFSFIGFTGTDELSILMHDRHVPKGGRISFRAGAFTDLPSSESDFEALKSDVIGISNDKSLEFSNKFSQKSGITYAGNDITGKLLDVSLLVNCDDCLYHVTLYPSPENGLFKIRISGPGITSGTVRVVNSAGQTVKELRFDSPDELQVLDLRGQATGIYLLQIDGSERISTHKMIIE